MKRSMKERSKEATMKKRILALVLSLGMLSTMAAGCVKVVKIGEEGKYTGQKEFNAGDNVAEIWDSQAIPELTEKAVDLAAFLGEANGDLTSLADKYGKYSMGTSGELNYVVKGTGTVEEVNQESKAGYMTVKLDNYTGSEIVKIQIGSVYKGSSVRDSLSFIDFNDYTNQEEWGAVSKSINELIDKEVVQPVKPTELQGKTVSFTGAFTAGTAGEILITPVTLETE